jgi:sphinganine-1-phosphate aldolase
MNVISEFGYSLNFNKLLNNFNVLFQKVSNKQIFYIMTTIFCFNIYNKIKNKRNKLAEILYLVPYLNRKINNKIQSQSKELENSLKNNEYQNLTYFPNKAFTKTELTDKLKVLNKNTNMYVSGVIYGNKDLDEIVSNFYKSYFKSNPLHPDIYPEIRMMEIDIINICKSLYKGKNSVGNITSGGTESILLSCLTYRDYCRERKNIINPNIIGFNTIHPAFDKACHYFGITLVKVKDILEMKRNINNNTICIVGSAPDYPYGLIDPINELNNLALENKTNLHIDACMGGFLLPFIDEFSYINFNLEGVTSISMDTHKYGYAPKGSSVLLFRDISIKKYQHFINKDWCGGVYATPTILGSKSGAVIAGAWASLLLRGYDNFKIISNKINSNLKYLVDEIDKNYYLEVIGRPKLNIIGIKSNKLNMYFVVNEMSKKGWNLSVMQNPPSFHFCVTNNHTLDICKKLISDLEETCNTVKEMDNTNLEGTLAVYGANSNLETGLFVEEIINDYISLLSQTDISYRYN